jgi:hypothetical protein
VIITDSTHDGSVLDSVTHWAGHTTMVISESIIKSASLAFGRPDATLAPPVGPVPHAPHAATTIVPARLVLACYYAYA